MCETTVQFCIRHCKKMQVFHPLLPALESIVQGAPLKNCATALLASHLSRTSPSLTDSDRSMHRFHTTRGRSTRHQQPSDDQRLVDHLVSTNHSVESTTTSILFIPSDSDAAISCSEQSPSQLLPTAHRKPPSSNFTPQQCHLTISHVLHC